jgi:molybdopterin synthase catalytic subunit
MICITDKPISPEKVVQEVRTLGSGCVVTYVGLIRDNSRGKSVRTVEYVDTGGEAVRRLQKIADDVMQRWPVNGVAIHHRIGVLMVGDINLVVAIAAGHRGEGFEACQHVIDRFKQDLPTSKKETYKDGSVWTGD